MRQKHCFAKHGAGDGGKVNNPGTAAVNLRGQRGLANLSRVRHCIDRRIRSALIAQGHVSQVLGAFEG